jgi:uncharacterized RDD family membrane protein YckC
MLDFTLVLSDKGENALMAGAQRRSVIPTTSRIKYPRKRPEEEFFYDWFSRGRTGNPGDICARLRLVHRCQALGSNLAGSGHPGPYLCRAAGSSRASSAPAYLFVAIAGIGYFPVFEHIYGRTLGKLVCRVRVVDTAGARPSWGQACVRTLLRLIEVNPALLGGLPAGIAVLTSKKRQRIGDMAANTFVLREEDYRYLTQLRTFSEGGHADHAVAPPLPLPPPPQTSSSAEKWLIPTNRSGWCIAAGYLGLFAILMLPAPIALAAGIIGLRDVRRNPGLGGRGRAWFGIIMGALFSLLLLAVIVSSK